MHPDRIANNPTLLAIGYVWPEPRSSAAGAHMMSLLRLFRDNGYRVLFASPAQRSEYMADLADKNIETADILLNDSSFDTFAADLQPDIVLFDRFMMEEQFGWRVERNCPEALRILDTEDLQCLRHARQQAHREQRPPQAADLFSDLAKREIAAILRSDLSLIISDHEMALLQESFHVDGALLQHLPFMLNLDEMPSSGKPFSERHHFVTIGNFRHAPNWDSVLYLQQIWPLIRKTLPTAQLHIYGSYAPKKAMALNNPQTGFLVKGRAEDALTALSEARVCLAPLRFGAGIKGKLIDAMLAGTPSVTTDLGSEGMNGKLPWPGRVANSAEGIAEAAIELYQNEALWQASQQRIAPVLQTRYDGRKLGEALLSRITALRENLETHRQNNFTGAMLRHHSMRSTEYMSRWIEAKNKP